MRQLIARALVAVLCWSFASVSNAQATFSTYLDIDGNAANGCTVTLPGGTLSGIDKRIQVTATTGATPGVTGVTLSNCTAGVFGAPVALSGASPVGLNNGTAGSDVVEFSAPLASMFPAGTFQARMGFVGENTGGSDVLFTTNGGPDGGPIVLGLGIPIPMLGLGGLLVLGVLVLVFANRFGRNRLAARVLGASLVLVSGASIAANFIVDGQVGDWAGVNALATDPAGDATNNSAAIDLRAGFAAVENNAIYFRLDVSDLQNQPPVANAQTVTLNEDGTLTITLTATDPEAQPLTFAIGTNPTNGALSGLTQVPPSSATVLYTPTANYFGPDSFTFTANDGQATSAPATVSITVNPVNDAPVNTVPAAQNIAHTTSLIFSTANGTALSVADPDAGTGDLRLQLSLAPPAGTLSLGSVVGLVSVVGNGTASVTATGPLNALNTALQGMTYVPTTGTSATVALTMAVDDQGNTPAPAQSDSDVVTVDVDVPPSVVTVTPANGASSVLPTANLVVTFSEPVNFVAGDFSISCNSTPQTSTIAGNGTATATLTPSGAGLLPGASCVFTVLGNTIGDVDLRDPPNFIGSNTVVNFTTLATANDDTYAVTPHLTLGIGATAPQGGGVLQNDLAGAAVITGFGFAPACTGTAVGAQLDAGGGNGRLTLNADGSFSYEPPASVAGASRTFCYTITGGDTANIVFNIQTTEFVWFVDPDVGAGGNGTQARPFLTLTDAAAVDSPNDAVFIPFDLHTCGITLEAGERIVGEGASATLDSILGIMPVAGSAFPPTRGIAPRLSVRNGACLTLSTNNLLRGFDIYDSDIDILGSAFGELVITEMSLAGTGQALNLSNGIIDASFRIIVSLSSAAENLRLDNVSGVMTTGGLMRLSGAVGNALDIQNSGARLRFGDISTVLKDGSGTGVSINSSSGLVSFNQLDVSTTGGAAVATIAANVEVSAGTIRAETGPGIRSANTNWNSTSFTSVSSNASSTQGVDLNNISGTLNLGAGSITNSIGTAFQVQGNVGTASYAGSISKANAGKAVVVSGGAGGGTLTLSGNINCDGGCTGIDVLNRPGGSYTFSGASKVLNTDASAGVTLTNNTGATIDFTGGGLDIDTTTGVGFEATGGGTISVQGANNTIDSVSATALSVVNTTIGAANLTFQRVSSGNATAAADPVNGIVLNTTGTSGGMTITGAGVAASGGVIQNTTGTGIALTSTRNVSIDRLNIATTGLHGVSGTGVVNFAMSNGSISNAGNADGESALFFGTPATTNLTGTANFTALTLTNFFEFGLRVSNTTGALTLNATNSAFQNNDDTFGESAISIQPSGTAGAVVNVTGSTFDNVEGSAVFYSAEGTGSNDINIVSNTVTNPGGPDDFPLNPAISLISFDQNTVSFDIQSNNLQQVEGDGVVIVGDGNMQGRVGGSSVALGNTIAGDAGGGVGDGVRLDMDGVFGAVINSATFTWTTLVQNNTARIGTVGSQLADDGVQVLNRDHTGTMNLTMSNNTFVSTLSEGIRYFGGERGTPVLGDTNGVIAGTNNLLANTSTAVGELDIVALTTDQAVACFNLNGNTRAAPPFEIDFQEADTSDIRITQASLGALGTANGAAVVTESDPSVTFNAACAPPLPINP
jgi:hypothetical protein